MKVDKQILIDVLHVAISEAASRPKTFLQKYKKCMSDMYNIPLGDSVDILNGKIPLESMSDDTLFKVTNVLYELNKTNEGIINAEDLNVDLFFTQINKDNFDRPLEDKKIDGNIYIDNWLLVNKDQYVCVFTIEQIWELRNIRRIKYNERTQRQVTIKLSKGVEVKSVTLVEDSRISIHGLMEKNEFISDDLTFNVNLDLYDPPYVNKAGQLVIPEKSVVDIIDGFHRYLEMCSVKDDNPNWSFNTIVNVVVFSEEKANRYIWQKDKKNHLSDAQATKLDKSNLNNLVIDRLKESSNFYLRDQIDDDLYVVISKIITTLFNIKKTTEAFPIYQNLEKNINSLIEHNNLLDRQFKKEDWFVFLCVTKYCMENNKDFLSIVENFTDDIISKLKFSGEPKGQYKIIEEVMKNV